MPRNHDVKYNSVARLGANKLNLLSHATGDCFCNLDGDDHYCDVNFIDDAIFILQNYPDVSIVAFGYRRVIDGVYGNEIVLPQQGIIPKSRYLQEMYIHVGACVLRMFQDHERMDLLNKTGFFDDSIITSNSLYYGEIYSVPRAIYGYYERPGSIMTSMNIIDTALHNCQGCDLDIQVVRPENREDIFQRYAYAIIRVYLYKKSIYKYIGNERYEMYLNECKKIDNSLTYKLLTYYDLDKSSKKSLNREVFHLIVSNLKLTAFLLINYFFKNKLAN